MHNDKSHNLEDLCLFAGSSCTDLSNAIASHLQIPLGKIETRRFSDGEINIELMENVRGKSVYIIQSTSTPANDNLMELLLIADTCRRASAASITAVVPYLGYSRQDRRPRSARVPISARVVADMLDVIGINRLLTMDLHAEQIQGFYSIPVENIYAMPVLMGDMSNVIDNSRSIIVAPDIGGVVRARAFASALGVDLAIIDKRRPRANVAKVMHIIGDIAGKDCFIVDDIVDTANTLCEAARALKEKGANRVAAYCTHAVLSGSAVERVSASAIDEMVICDTIPPVENTKQCDTMRVLTVAPILAETVSRLHRHKSITSLF